ncbi:MAG: type II toxin-antitoxin system VapC family toxin [Terracidiphilus sp.]
MILLDTHAALWFVARPEKLSLAADEAISRVLANGEDPAISVVSLYELANSIRRGRVPLTVPRESFLESVKQSFTILPVSPEIALCAGSLPEPFHGDPMDRMIAATAIVEGCALVTADGKIQNAAVCRTVW